MTYHAHTRPRRWFARMLTAIVCRRAPDQVIADEGRLLSRQQASHKSAPVGTSEIDLQAFLSPPPKDGAQRVYINRWVLWSSAGTRKDRMSDAARHGARLLLHEVLRADADVRPHNHPWDWAIALVIDGGYAEVRLTNFCGVTTCTTWRWPWRPYLLTGNSFHRISNLRHRASWSLFLHGPRRHGWGFLHAMPAADGSDNWGAAFEPFVDTSTPPDGK